jgi:hypothetical protein
VVVTENPDEESERDWMRALHLPPHRHYPYSRVHQTIAAARKILASVPSKNVDTPLSSDAAF